MPLKSAWLVQVDAIKSCKGLFIRAPIADDQTRMPRGPKARDGRHCTPTASRRRHHGGRTTLKHGTSNRFNPTILHDPRRMMVRVTDLSTLPTFDDISAASSRIADGIFHTLCFEAPALSMLRPHGVYQG